MSDPPPTKRAKVAEPSANPSVGIALDGLSRDEQKRYDRQLRVWGADGQRKLGDTHVLVVGAGPLGLEVAKNLVLAGVGLLTLSDSLSVASADVNTIIEHTCACSLDGDVVDTTVTARDRVEQDLRASYLARPPSPSLEKQSKESPTGSAEVSSASSRGELAVVRLRALNTLVTVSHDNHALRQFVASAAQAVRSPSAKTGGDVTATVHQPHVVIVCADGALLRDTAPSVVSAVIAAGGLVSTGAKGEEDNAPSGAAVIFALAAGLSGFAWCAPASPSYTVKAKDRPMERLSLTTPLPNVPRIVAALGRAARREGAQEAMSISVRNVFAATRVTLAAWLQCGCRDTSASAPAERLAATAALTERLLECDVARPARVSEVHRIPDGALAEATRWWSQGVVSVPASSVFGAVLANEVVGLVTEEGRPASPAIVWDGRARIAFVEELTLRA
eukprot:TRINITY_DN4024_c0_g1_i2.p1 TRINITY_DN4024_c0_g1~~TRINITY_DN4024_c0_g1_i2.p1  ORF type:complete len:465 (+),score=37.75 TRINITY_DN4024_c0_g1_i2:54-1397(+)